MQTKDLIFQPPQWIVRTGLGQDSHRFLPESYSKPCILGGIIFDQYPGFQANSDGDVVFHSICNALTSIHHKKILGGAADELLHAHGITDSAVYVAEALKFLQPNQLLTHVSISIEGQRPRIADKLQLIRQNVATVLRISEKSVGITSTSGEGLTDMGCGDGVQCFCIATVLEHVTGMD